MIFREGILIIKYRHICATVQLLLFIAPNDNVGFNNALNNNREIANELGAYLDSTRQHNNCRHLS